MSINTRLRTTRDKERGWGKHWRARLSNRKGKDPESMNFSMWSVDWSCRPLPKSRTTRAISGRWGRRVKSCTSGQGNWKRLRGRCMRCKTGSCSCKRSRNGWWLLWRVERRSCSVWGTRYGRSSKMHRGFKVNQWGRPTITSRPSPPSAAKIKSCGSASMSSLAKAARNSIKQFKKSTASILPYADRNYKRLIWMLD